MDIICYNKFKRRSYEKTGSIIKNGGGLLSLTRWALRACDVVKFWLESKLYRHSVLDTESQRLSKGDDIAIADRALPVRNDDMFAPLAKGGLRGDCIINNPTTAMRSPSLYKGGNVRNDEKRQTVKNLFTYLPIHLFTSKKAAFTLAEVIIVMLVIAVIVAVSIKATKAKLNHITSYTYYAAYSTINSVTKEMLKDFNADDENYTTSNNKFWRLFSSPAFAKDCFYRTDYENSMYSCYNYVAVDACDVANFDCDAHAEQINMTVEDCSSQKQRAYALYHFSDEFDILNNTGGDYLYFMSAINELFPEDTVLTWISTNCTHGSYRWTKTKGWNNVSAMHCTDAQQTCGWGAKEIYFTYELLEDDDETPEEPGGGSGCTPTPCTGGNTFDEASCTCVCNQTAPDPIPCGKEWSVSECQLVDISPWPPVCESGKEFNPDESVCGCVPIPQAIPRTGENYCKLFVSYANTSQLAEDDECSGDAIADDEVDFSDKEPDMILRNGMYLYNVSQDPQPIDALTGNSKGRTYTKTEDDGSTTVVDLDEWGYTLYIDIDGARGGNGVLWEDVYPFYVTLSGKVIPAYDTANAGLSGGDSKLHLQTSVADEYIDDATGHKLDWITKSVPFKTSACSMDYVKATTPYCSTAPAVTTNAQCATTGHDCRLKTIMPVKFF